MKNNRKLLVVCLAVPLTVGIVAGLATRSGMADFEMLTKPPLSPPGWLFPVVWTVLYLLMGYGSYLVAVSGAEPEKIRRALGRYGIQLMVNFVWPFLFFSLQAYLPAFFWLVLLWGLILLTMLAFYRIHPKAGDLLLPYLLWVTFAGYLNFGIWLLN